MHSAIYADQVLRGLALSVARNDVGAQRPLHEVLASEGIAQSDYADISTNPQFQRYLTIYTAELKDNGFSFSAKSRILAEDLLPAVYHMAKDPDVPAQVRMKSIENLVEWGDLKPKTATNLAQNGGFSITINLPGTLSSPPETLVLDAQTVEKTPISDQNQPKKLQNKALITLEEPDDYEYAGDDYL